MSIGRLAFPTPTGAMLWEIWGRRRLNFALHALAFLMSLLCVHWIQRGVSEIPRAILTMIPVIAFFGSYLDLLTCFGYIEIDAMKVQIGYPNRLLLKPVSSAKLALVPMTFGGAAVLIVLLLWNQLILQPVNHSLLIDPFWLGAVTLSFFWWIQAIAWSLPLVPSRSLITLAVAITHLLVGLMPTMPCAIPAGWRWLILTGMLLSAVGVALLGLKWMRCGSWEARPRPACIPDSSSTAKTQVTRKNFASAFRAQFWLEWRRQGVSFPGLAGGIAFAIPPIIYVMQKELGEKSNADFGTIAISLMLIIPIMLSGVMGPAISKFDPLQPANELPIYIAIRPMTNGTFVLAKLVMALASSALAWLLTIAAVCLWLALLDPGHPFSKAASVSPYGLGGFLIGCLPALLLLILFTWKNLIAGIGVGLTGRPWLIGVIGISRMFFSLVLVSLIATANFSVEFKAVLMRWLPWILITGLTVKIIFSTIAFIFGIRRNAITRGTVVGIVGGWLACSLFAIGYAGLICRATQRLDLWIPITLGVFLILPLADLAIAPLAMAWNRHR